jgi:hypothetical protein
MEIHFSYNTGGEESEIKVLAGLVSFVFSS